MKKIMFMAALVAVCLCAGTVYAQSGVTDDQVSALAAIKGSKIRPVEFSSAPTAAQWSAATKRVIRVGDIYANTTTKTLHYATATTPTWALIGGGTGTQIVISYAGCPTVAQYLAVAGRNPALKDLIWDTTAIRMKYVSVASPVTCTEMPVTASAVVNTAAGTIAATEVQAAINELDNEKLALAGGTMTGATVISDGAVGTPSVAMTGDLNTGIYHTAGDSNTILFSTGGSQILSMGATDITVPTGKNLIITDAPAAGTEAANKTYVDNALLFGTQLTASGGVSVNLGAIAVTPLYTCPAGKKCVIEKVVIRSASANVDQAADATYDIGWDAVASGVVASVALITPTVTTTSWHPVVVGVGSAAEQTMGTAAQVLNFNVTAACTTDPTTIRVDVFGYAY